MKPNPTITNAATPRHNDWRRSGGRAKNSVVAESNAEGIARKSATSKEVPSPSLQPPIARTVSEISSTYTTADTTNRFTVI